jgi:ankyrin repeat protein
MEQSKEEKIAPTAHRRYQSESLSCTPSASLQQSGRIQSFDTSARTNNSDQQNLISRLQESWTTNRDFLGASTFQLHGTSSWGSSNDFYLPTSRSTSKPVDSQGRSSAIHDAARITDWPEVLRLCREKPEWAGYTGKDGWTALHHMCNRRCPDPEVARALIAAAPETLWLPEEKNGWLPLHYACRFKAPKAVVYLLLHLDQRGKHTVSKRDHMGRTPLFYAVRYDAPPGVVGLLLQLDPNVVLEEDYHEDSPLALVWNTWAEKLEGKRIVASFLPGGFPEPEDTSAEERAVFLRKRLEKETKLKERWDKANLLLKAAFGFPVEDDDETEAGFVVPSTTNRKWRIVHATAAVKCHLSLFRLACALHPEQVSELDCGDLRPGTAPQTALHLAASSNASGELGKMVIITLLSLYREAAKIPDETGSLPLHRLVENPRKTDWTQHAAILTEFYPRAVQIPDNFGLTPLHRAARAMNQHEVDSDDENEDDETERSVIVQLVRSFPQAALQADEASYMPIHYACQSGTDWNADMETILNAARGAVQVFARGSLPLHLAASNPRSTAGFLQKLIQLHPRAATLPDADGFLPFQLACRAGKSWSDISVLYDAYPAALQIATPEFPLQLACRHPYDTDLVRQLVQLYPEAAAVRDNTGRYPIHYACATKKTWETIEALVHAHAISVASTDQMGEVPFHVLALAVCSQHDDSTEELPSWLCDPEPDPSQDLTSLFELLRIDPTVLV